MPKRGDIVYIPFTKESARNDKSINNGIENFKRNGISRIYENSSDGKKKLLHQKNELLYIMGHCKEGADGLFCKNKAGTYEKATAKNIAKNLIPEKDPVKITEIKVLACEAAKRGDNDKRFISELKKEIRKLKVVSTAIKISGFTEAMSVNSDGLSEEHKDGGNMRPNYSFTELPPEVPSLGEGGTQSWWSKCDII
jgi:hypothetical protein